MYRHLGLEIVDNGKRPYLILIFLKMDLSEPNSFMTLPLSTGRAFDRTKQDSGKLSKESKSQKYMNQLVIWFDSRLDVILLYQQ